MLSDRADDDMTLIRLNNFPSNYVDFLKDIRFTNESHFKGFCTRIIAMVRAAHTSVIQYARVHTRITACV